MMVLGGMRAVGRDNFSTNREIKEGSVSLCSESYTQLAEPLRITETLRTRPLNTKDCQFGAAHRPGLSEAENRKWGARRYGG